jgi:hypothetical protein
LRLDDFGDGTSISPLAIFSCRLDILPLGKAPPPELLTDEFCLINGNLSSFGNKRFAED